MKRPLATKGGSTSSAAPPRGHSTLASRVLLAADSFLDGQKASYMLRLAGGLWASTRGSPEGLNAQCLEVSVSENTLL